MKLLFLGLILICVLIIQIYLIKDYQESFLAENAKIIADGERAYLHSQKKYWGIRSQGIGAGILVGKPGMNDWFKLDDKTKKLTKFTPELSLDKSEIDTNVTNCRAITNCEQLNNKQCGYCAYDKEFRYGDEDGPHASVCPKEVWTQDPTECSKLREKEICSNVKSCADLYGEAEKLCGYCPTAGVAMVMKKIGDKYVPKYSDDICRGEGHNLLPIDKCLKFAQDHPCITPYYLSGPHNTECIKKLWKNSKCTAEKPYGKTIDELTKSIEIPYFKVGETMNKTNDDTRSTNYYTAIANSDFCFGDHNNIDPCDQKYNQQNIPHPVCLKRELLDVGCTEKGTSYKLLKKSIDDKSFNDAKKHIENISKYSKDQQAWDLNINYPFSNSTTHKTYKDTIKRVNNLMTDADDYSTRVDTSMKCLGIMPPPPPPIEPGCVVRYNIVDVQGSLKLEGMVTKKIGDMCRVMWTTYTKNGIKVKREDMSGKEQKAFLGWPGLAPTVNTRIPAEINKRKLHLVSCCEGQSDPKSSICVRDCQSIILALEHKFPKPRDCVVNDWGKWGPCSASCDGGFQERTRTIKYPAKLGGEPCPVLKIKKVCNTQACTNPYFCAVNDLL